MESDCTKLTIHTKMSSLRKHYYSNFSGGIYGVIPAAAFSAGRTMKSRSEILVIILVAIVWSVPMTSSTFIDCNSINAAKKCDCTKTDEFRIECPIMKPQFESFNQDSQEYPITLLVQNEPKSGSTYLTVRCSTKSSEFQWNLIEGVDLSQDKIGSVIEKLIIEYCPMVDDGLGGFFDRVNLTGEQLTKLTFISAVHNISKIPQNFFSRMKNLESLVLTRNKLIEVPGLSGLSKLKELNLRDNNIVRIPSQTFAENKNLVSLAFARNQLAEIDTDTIPESISNLLDFDGNQKLILPPNFFTRLTNLSTFFFRNINLSEIDGNAFSDLPQLKTLALNMGTGLKKSLNIRNLTSLTELQMNYLTQTSPNVSLNLVDLPSLDKFSAVSSGLQTLPRFTNVPNLDSLNLRGNIISNLSVEFFEQVKSVTSLDLSKNRIEELVEIKATSLKSLDLSNNQITRLTPLAFRHLQALESLNLRKNKIKFIEFKAFESQGLLQYLDMSQNLIEFDVSPFAKFQSQAVDFFPSENQSPLHPCSNLRTLNLSHNPISIIYDDWRMSKIKLAQLDLSFNSFTNISAPDLDFVAQNLKLNLSNNQISTVNLEKYSIILHDKSSSIDVYLDRNPFHCDCLAYNVKNFSLTSHHLHFNDLTCASPEPLEGYYLKNISDRDLVCPLNDGNPNCPKPCYCHVRPSDKTLVSDCSNKEFTNEDLSGLTWNLSRDFITWNAELNLSNNSITEYKVEYLSTIPINQTRRIDLSRNKLLSVSFIRSLREDTKVSLSHNPFVCNNCSDFVIPWATYSQQIDDSANVTCLRGSANELESGRGDEVQLQDISSLVDEFCTPSLAAEIRLLIIICGVFAVFCVALILIIFRYAWVIKAYLYSKGWGWCLFWDSDFDPEDEEKLYDAFVSYSHKDEEVIDELVNRLEGKEGFKLCLHFRDWTPGDWIPDQIVKSVDQSKRTVVILSKNFVESVWSRLEFKAAHAQALSQRSNRVILVLLEDDLKENDVKDDDLRLYMKTNTYLKWNDRWFWHKLKYALPHRKSNDDQQDILRKMEQRERAIQLDKLRAKLEQTV